MQNKIEKNPKKTNDFILNKDKIKCPGCDLMLPSKDTVAQMMHMDKEHPDIIAKRRQEL